MAFGGKDLLGCGKKYCANLEKGDPAGMEPTVCNTYGDCDAHGKKCFTPDLDLCPGFKGEEGSKGAENTFWAKSCACIGGLQYPDTGTQYPFHCNYASGFCTAGDSPFKEPLGTCESSGSLVFGESGYNRLCYISPLWKCANKIDVDECRKEMGWQLQGPSLCRSFCEPTFENRNNRLTQYVYSDDSQKCVCEVGVDRAYPNADANVSSSQAVRVQSVPARKRKRRSLLEEGFEKDTPYDSCTTNYDCEPTYLEPTLCKTIWDSVTPCYSCSERIHGNGGLGFACSPETKTCECTAPVSVDPEDERNRPDEVDWRGSSWCDKIMRAYRLSAIRSPLENAWVQRCSDLRIFGINMMHWIGLQSVPPDVFYNPSRLLWVGMDVSEGVYAYFHENWDEKGRSTEDFFDRLIELQVDPILTFKVLDYGQKLMSIGASLIAMLDPVAAVGEVLSILNPEVSALYSEGVNATAMSF